MSPQIEAVKKAIDTVALEPASIEAILIALIQARDLRGLAIAIDPIPVLNALPQRKE